MTSNFWNARALAVHPKSTAVKQLISAALDAADPVESVRKAIRRSNEYLWIGDSVYDLGEFDHVYVVGAGKASVSMTRGVLTVLGDRVSGGVLIAKHLNHELLDGFPLSIRFLQGSHPVPDEKSVQSTQEIIEFLEDCTARDLVLCLISGGGSALMTSPAEGIHLEDLQKLTRLLLACGADIGEINTLRKHLDQIKGGRLARLAHPARLVTLILSDVIGSPLDVIASGPTVADPTTYHDAIQILRKYSLENEVPLPILSYLQAGLAGSVPESVKAGEACLKDVYHLVVSSNYQAAIHVVENAKKQGFHSLLLTTYLRGEAREAGVMLASILREVAASGNPVERPLCLVVGGETTVTLQGDGKGGRNTELALGAVRELAGLENVMLVTLATDGEDGPTDAAGAVVTGETLQRGMEMGLLPEPYLQNNDSYHYFEALGDLMRTGSTGTNVNDLVFLFAF